MSTEAVIDFSTSSISLLVGDGKRSVLHKRVPQTFASSLYKDRVLTEVEAYDFIRTAKEMIQLSKEAGAGKVYAIVSFALQSVKDIEKTLAETEEKTGLKLYRLTQKEEAELRMDSNRKYEGREKCLLADIGSVSLKLFTFSGVLETVQTGPLDLYREFVTDIYPDKKEAKAMKKSVYDSLDEANIEQKDFESIVFSGAYAWAVRAVYESEEGKDYDGTLDYDRLKKLIREMTKERQTDIRPLASSPELKTLSIPSMIIVKATMKHFGIKKATVSDSGVKEGTLIAIKEGRLNAGFLEL